MKHIIKKQEPQTFLEWKANANEDWIPTYDKLSGATKNAVYKSLQQEQGYICCYCERKLKSNDFHIEHLNPQEKHIIDPLDYSNMLCSCQREIEKGAPRHCGNSKENWYEKDMFISPLDSDCETKFKYTADGQILPSEQNNEAAKTTIEKLKLDIDKLISLRKNTIEPFLNLDEYLSDSELKLFIEDYLKDKNENEGEFNEFYTTIKSLFGHYIT